MVGVFFEPMTTKVCNISFGNQKMVVDYHQVFRRGYTGLFKKYEDWDYEFAVKQLSSFFSTLRKEIHESKDGIYIVIPDYLFTAVKCIRWQTPEEFTRELADNIPISLDEIYYCEAMKSNPDGQVNISSVYAIEKGIIDAFYKAALDSGIIIKSIEAASLGYFRAAGQMDVENFIAEVYAYQACGVYFSVVAGIFMTDLSDLAYSKLFKITPSDANAQIRAAFKLNDDAANRVYDGFLDEGVPYTFFTDDKSVLELHGFNERIDIEKKFPGFVKSYIQPKDQLDWLPLIGTFLQDYPDQREVYKTLPRYARFYSGNIISDEMKRSAHVELLKRRVISTCKKVSALLVLAIGIETGFGFYFGSSDIPSNLQSDYTAAQEESKLIDKEFAILDSEKNEHMNFLAAYSNILNAMPEGVFISDLKMVQPDSSKKDKQSANFATVTAVSADPVLIQNFAAQLSGNGKFTNVTISKMDTDNKDVAKADILIGRSSP